MECFTRNLPALLPYRTRRWTCRWTASGTLLQLLPLFRADKGFIQFIPCKLLKCDAQLFTYSNATGALTTLTTPRDTVDLMVPLHKRSPSSCLIRSMPSHPVWHVLDVTFCHIWHPTDDSNWLCWLFGVQSHLGFHKTSCLGLQPQTKPKTKTQIESGNINVSTRCVTDIA